MNDEPRGGDSLEAIRRAASTLLPELTRRLTEHRLGELEVQHGDVRIRVRASASSGSAQRSHAAGAGDAVPTGQPGIGATAGADGETPPTQPASASVVSPAVGIFIYGQGLGPGLDVSAGDQLGHVEMLGVQYEVRAPESGRVTHLVAETGEAVEYGQVLIELQRERAA